MNKKDVRIQSMIRELSLRPEQSVAELAALFQVSQMTIRRDLQYIEQNRLLRPEILHGGRTAGASRYEYLEEEIRNAEQKRRIAEFALGLLKPGEIVALDSGTTAGMLAAVIPDDMPLTVICYSYYIVSKLYDRSNIDLILAGGYYHHNTQTFESTEGMQFLKQLRARKMFLCASGVHETMGITCTDQHIASMKRAALSISSEKILLCDSSKFGEIRSGFISSLEDLDMIVTDQGISPAWESRLRETGAEVHIV
ncbi:MAG: DeoR/GlpR transcriptional regulator [Lachnospiraceae bacterium]|nr:DeoR/GlpR transcriptional regulator [Lachnospiraceae bacterium]